MVRIGFDVGGTDIKAGIVENMKIAAKRVAPFPKKAPYQRAIDVMEGLAYEMLKERNLEASQVKSIGIAVPGDIDTTSSIVLDAYNLGFHKAPLKAEMMGRFPGIPVSLLNDANAAALAELHVGAFVGCKTGVLITLGTGVGGGLILGGKMFNGGMKHGVELGHMTLIYDGPPCTCGNKGCIETVCTATWLLQEGKKAALKNKDGGLYRMAEGDIEKINAKIVVDCAKAGDSDALEIFNRYVGYLSAAISSIAALLDPEVVAIGGGVSNAGDFLFEPLREQVKRTAFFRYPYKIVQAKLGNDAGVIGAAIKDDDDAGY